MVLLRSGSNRAFLAWCWDHHVAGRGAHCMLGKALWLRLTSCLTAGITCLSGCLKLCWSVLKTLAPDCNVLLWHLLPCCS